MKFINWKIKISILCLLGFLINLHSSEKIQTSIGSNYKMFKSKLHKAHQAPQEIPAKSKEEAEVNSNEGKSAGEDDVKGESLDIPDAPFYFQGWVKYAKIEEGQSKGKNGFVENPRFRPSNNGTEATLTKEDIVFI